MLTNGDFIYIPSMSDGTMYPAPRKSQGYDQKRQEAMLGGFWAEATIKGEVTRVYGNSARQALARLDYLLNEDEHR